MTEFARIKKDIYQRVEDNMTALVYEVMDIDGRITPDFTILCYDKWTDSIYATTAHQRDYDGQFELTLDTVITVARPLEKLLAIFANDYGEDSLICDRRIFDILRNHPNVTVLEENKNSLAIGTLNGILNVFTTPRPVLTRTGTPI